MFYIRMIAAALLPAVLLLLYIWKKDTQKEPIYMLLKAVAWGIGMEEGYTERAYLHATQGCGMGNRYYYPGGCG